MRGRPGRDIAERSEITEIHPGPHFISLRRDEQATDSKDHRQEDEKPADAESEQSQVWDDPVSAHGDLERDHRRDYPRRHYHKAGKEEPSSRLAFQQIRIGRDKRFLSL